MRRRQVKAKVAHRGSVHLIRVKHQHVVTRCMVEEEVIALEMLFRWGQFPVPIIVHIRLEQRNEQVQEKRLGYFLS